VLPLVADTLFLQRNDLNGTWPEEYCVVFLQRFGIDCDRIKCSSEACCPPEDVCFYSGAGEGMPDSSP
jgi:hypothetical protein